MNTDTRDAALDRLAMGSHCPECGADTDETCTTRRAGRPTNPHRARIDRACGQYKSAEPTVTIGDTPMTTPSLELIKSPTAVYVTPDGTVYRVKRAGICSLTDEWREDYDVLTIDGAQTHRSELPSDAVLVWSPSPTGAEIGRLADQLEKGWHVPSGYWGLAYNVLAGITMHRRITPMDERIAR